MNLFTKHVKRKLRMAVLSFLTALLCGMSNTHAEKVQTIEEVKLTINLKSVNVEQVLKSIEEKTNFRFLYISSKLENEALFDFKVKKKTVAKILGKLFDGRNLTYKQVDEQIIIKTIPKPETESSLSRRSLQFGAVIGKVYDASNGEPLPGATVRVANTNTGDVTRLDGSYFIAKVPLGKHTVVVNYIGFDQKSVEVEVTEFDMTVVNFEMTVSATKLEGVTISGLLEGQTKALNQQKSAENIKNIVSADQIGRFPDLNTAEAVQRIPGAGISRDQGEGRYVQVRGLPPGLTNISINGEQIPSPEGEFRYVALDVIPIDQLASIEITKTITPDMDGDAIGGSVNLITKSAKDEVPRVSGTVAGGYNNLMDDFTNYQVQASYGQRFNKLGVSFNGSMFRNNRGSDNNEFIYREEDFGSGDEFVLDQLQLRDYEIERRRIGLSSTLDYKFNESSQIYIRSIYNYYTDQEFRRRFRFRPGSGDYVSPTEARGIRLVNELKDREQTQEIWSINAGGEHNLSKFTLDYEFAYAEASEDELDRIDIGFEHAERPNVTIDRSDPDFPKFTIADRVDRFDYAQYEFDELELTDRLRTDRNITGKINLKIPVRINGNDGFVKAGVKYRDKRKDRINNVQVYGNDFINAADEFTLADVLGDFRDEDFLEGQYNNGLFADPGQIRAFRDRVRTGSILEEDLLGSTEESDGPFYEAEEKVLAAYVMSRVQLNKLMVLGGVRLEQTNVDYRANELIFDEDVNGEESITVNSITGSNDYTFVLPNLQFKYEVDNNTNMRAAFTWSYARPNFEDIVPFRSINQQDQEIAQGNPAVEPTSSFNIDVLGEHYFKNIGIFSGGVFYKRIRDFNFSSIRRIQGGALDGFVVETVENGGLANLWGIELNWQQNFTFLPGFLSGFGVYANYTYTHSDASVMRGNNPDVLVEEDISLPGQADHLFNFALNYSKGKFQGRLAAMYNGSFISNLSQFADQDEISDDRLQLDFSASYGLNDNFRVFTEVINITDAPVRFYQGVRSRPTFQEFYSWWARVGLKFNLAQY